MRPSFCCPCWLCSVPARFLLGSCSSPTPISKGPSGAAPELLRFENGVRSILEDSQGNFWFGGYNEGLARFDGEHLSYFTEADGLSGNQVRSIYEDQDGVIWFESGQGLSSFDGERITTRTDKNYTSRQAWQKSEHDLWFKGDEEVGYNEAERNPGVYRYAGNELTYLEFPDLGETEGDNYFSVTSTDQRDGERIWFGTYGAVIGYDDEAFTVINNASLGRNEQNGWLHVRAVLEDRAGRLWIGNNGIGVILRENGASINFSEQMKLSKAHTLDQVPSLHRVFALDEDHAGNIWFGVTDYGIWRYDGESLTNFGEGDGLAAKTVLAIYTDPRGDLWVAGEAESGVFKFNGTSFDRVF